MINDYEYYLELFHSPAPDFTQDIPLDLPSGETIIIGITTVNKKGLNTLEASGLYPEFEKNWANDKGDFVMTGIAGETRFMWTVLKQDTDCGIVTFHMGKKYHNLAGHILEDLSKLIKAQSMTEVVKPVSGMA